MDFDQKVKIREEGNKFRKEIQDRLDHHKTRLKYIERLKNLQHGIPGSKLSFDKEYMPTWSLKDSKGKVLATVSSTHVWCGMYNHWFRTEEK